MDYEGNGAGQLFLSGVPSQPFDIGLATWESSLATELSLDAIGQVFYSY